MVGVVRGWNLAAAAEARVEDVAKGVSEHVLERAFEYWKNVDKQLGEKVESAVRNG